ncbi:uncharacterized protein [Oscarella lobularis]
MTHITSQKSVEVDLLSVDGVANVQVKAFTDSTEEWEKMVKTKLLKEASRSTASPVPANEDVGGGIPEIIRNAKPLSVSYPKKNMMTIEDGGIFAGFSVVVSANDRAGLEKIRDEPVQIVIIQVVRGVYIARYYKSANDDCGLNIRTEFIHNAEDVVDRAGSLKEDTPAYDPYCTKLCKVGDLLEGKKLKATLRFYDHPSDSAFIKQKWNPQIIEKAKSAMNDQSLVQYDPDEESTLCSFEKYVPFTTWLAVRDPSTNEIYPKFCFDWVSQYKLTEVGGQYIHSLVCPPENIPEEIKQLPLFERFPTNDGDPRLHIPAYVHKQDQLPDLPEGIVKNCQTKVADKYTAPSIFYNDRPVYGANYDEASLPLVDSDYDEEKESGCFVVVATEWEEED